MKLITFELMNDTIYIKNTFENIYFKKTKTFPNTLRIPL